MDPSAAMAGATGDVWLLVRHGIQGGKYALERVAPDGRSTFRYDVATTPEMDLATADPGGAAVVLVLGPARTCLITAARKVTGCAKGLQFSPDGAWLLARGETQVQAFRWPAP